MLFGYLVIWLFDVIWLFGYLMLFGYLVIWLFDVIWLFGYLLVREYSICPGKTQVEKQFRGPGWPEPSNWRVRRALSATVERGIPHCG